MLPDVPVNSIKEVQARWFGGTSVSSVRRIFAERKCHPDVDHKPGADLYITKGGRKRKQTSRSTGQPGICCAAGTETLARQSPASSTAHTRPSRPAPPDGRTLVKRKPVVLEGQQPVERNPVMGELAAAEFVTTGPPQAILNARSVLRLVDVSA